MRILIATPFAPWPLHEGGRVAQFRTLEALKGVCDFTLLFPAYSVEQETDVHELKKRLPLVNFVPVRCYEPQAPPPPPPKPTLRRLVVSILRKMFPPPKEKSEGSAEFYQETVKSDLEHLPYYPFHNLHPNFVRAVDRELDKGYDIFQAEFCEMLSLGSLVGGRAKKLFIHHQLHFIYAQRFLKNLGDAVGPYHRYTLARIETEEKAYLEAFDSIIVFSDTDARELGDFLPDPIIHVSPFPCPENPVEKVVCDWRGGHFVFVASENHTPNAMGLAWFMEKVWPLLKAKIPVAKIQVIGKWSAKAQHSIPNSSQIEFSGFVEKLLPSLTGKIMIVPLWVGSGIRTKILAAWCVGCPVVSTSIGAEGLFGENGKEFILADDAKSFAEACFGLSNDNEKKIKIVSNASKTVDKNYSLTAVCEKRLNIYKKLIAESIR